MDSGGEKAMKSQQISWRFKNLSRIVMRSTPESKLGAAFEGKYFLDCNNRSAVRKKMRKQFH
jgi:hypothetical protein